MPTEPDRDIHHEEIPHADGRQELRVLYPSHDVATRNALETMADGLRRFGMGDCDIHTVQQVLAEILNNVVEHACAGDGNALIELRVILDGGAVHAHVTDSGRPMPGGTAPTSALPPPAELPEGGFGWGIIHAMADTVSYVREGRRNTLSVSLRLQRSS